LASARNIVVAILVWLAFASATFGSAGEDTERLERLRARIEKLQKELNATRERRDTTRAELDAAEKRIDTILRGLREMDTQLRQYTQTHNELRAQAERERTRLRAHSESLGAQLRAQYAMGQQPYLKLLLNQENPGTTARVLAYYRYFHQARLRRIEELQATLARLEQLDEQVARSTRALTAMREAREREHEMLEQTREHRRELLAGLNRKISDRTQELDRLRADEQRLERLVREIRTLTEPIMPLPGPSERFASLKGRLPLPVSGTLQIRYGEPRGIGALRWRGVFLSAKEGAEIRSVSRGRVAYADWLRGFGLLLILDHGDGYMTLYGHNQALYRRVGDWVEAGQPIATVGNTGDAPGTGLYFEIRHNGVPHDPLLWCSIGRDLKRRARR
jgi:murein hydrolase activator